MDTKLKDQQYLIAGMDCASCALTIEKGVSQLEGIDGVKLSFATEIMSIKGNVPQEKVMARVKELGYGIREKGDDVSAVETSPQNFWAFLWSRGETKLALLGGLLILPGLFLQELGGVEHPIINLFSILAMVVAGWPIARSAWQSLRISRDININVLMTAAAVGAVLIGAYTEAGMVMVLFALSEALEGYTAGRARSAIRRLMSLAPKAAVRLTAAGEETVPVAQLHVGDVIIVKPGAQISMDGRVNAGISAVNQAPITGESRLVDKEVGDEVFAGSINGSGVLEIEVTRLAADNTISRIVKMVSDAQDRQAPAQRFVDQFAKVYTPLVMGIALVVAVIPSLFFNQPFLNPGGGATGWLYRGLALLVVACPCALVVSTPVSLISAISNAAKRGVLFKGGAFVEALSKVKAVAFDKTGTLTAGQPTVLKVQAVSCLGEPRCDPCDDLLGLASAVEQRSEHPLARAILTEAGKRGVMDRYRPATEVMALVGRGVSGSVDGWQVMVGNHAYFDAHVPHSNAQCTEVENAGNGVTKMMVSVDGDYQGVITAADVVRESSKEVVAGLQNAGIPNLIMLTGDNQQTAEKIGQMVGVTDVRAALLPQDKAQAIMELQVQYGSVAMVGDGINDAPALATADVGIAAGGAAATAQAMETADITLMGDDLRQLPFAYRLSRAAMNTIKANIVFAIGIKLLFMVLVLMGAGTMWMAVIADMGASLLVTLNGMRLLRFKS